LNLVDLRGDNLLKMGVPADAVRASSHKLGQRWSLAFWSHSKSPDGTFTNLEMRGKGMFFDPLLTLWTFRPLNFVLTN
jgi:hypothetical protein